MAPGLVANMSHVREGSPRTANNTEYKHHPEASYISHEVHLRPPSSCAGATLLYKPLVHENLATQLGSALSPRRLLSNTPEPGFAFGSVVVFNSLGNSSHEFAYYLAQHPKPQTISPPGHSWPTLPR